MSFFFFFSTLLKLQCVELYLSEGLTTVITPLSSSRAKCIYPSLSISLFLRHLSPDIFRCGVKQPNEHSLWQKQKKPDVSLTLSFFTGKLKPSWIPGLTCNDPNHSRQPVGKYTCCWLPDISSWVEKNPEPMLVISRQCQMTSPVFIFYV